MYCLGYCCSSTDAVHFIDIQFLLSFSSAGPDSVAFDYSLGNLILLVFPLPWKLFHWKRCECYRFFLQYWNTVYFKLIENNFYSKNNLLTFWRFFAWKDALLQISVHVPDSFTHFHLLFLQLLLCWDTHAQTHARPNPEEQLLSTRQCLQMCLDQGSSLTLWCLAWLAFREMLYLS